MLGGGGALGHQWPVRPEFCQRCQRLCLEMGWGQGIGPVFLLRASVPEASCALSVQMLFLADGVCVVTRSVLVSQM